MKQTESWKADHKEAAPPPLAWDNPNLCLLSLVLGQSAAPSPVWTISHVVISSSAKPLMGSALGVMCTREGQSRVCAGPEEERRCSGLWRQGWNIGDAWAWQYRPDLELASFQKP